ncbi:MAG: hypothetical protein ACYTDT_09470 [Planctomycetota bacterium]
MIKKFLWVPMLVLVFVVTSCGASGGTADGKQTADAAFEKIINQEWDTLIDLKEQDGDEAALGEVRTWRIDEGYDRWKEYKKRLEGDDGYDPKGKSGIEGEDDWKTMSRGKGEALRAGFYRVYVNDEWEKRLTEMKWAYAGHSEELEVEGQGKASYTYMNGYGDSISIRCKRVGGLWYLTSAKLDMEKEVPKKPKDDE